MSRKKTLKERVEERDQLLIQARAKLETMTRTQLKRFLHGHGPTKSEEHPQKAATVVPSENTSEPISPEQTELLTEVINVLQELPNPAPLPEEQPPMPPVESSADVEDDVPQTAMAVAFRHRKIA